MDKTLETAPEEVKQSNFTLYTILVYLWMLVAKPQLRFEFIGTIQLEKIIVIVAFLSLVAGHRMKVKFNSISWFIIIFYCWLLLSYSVSQYQNYFITQVWMQTYWKFIVVYFLILFSVNTKKDIYILISGFVVIVGLFQMHSWFDFLNGGSYVFQQGVKRIIGVWTSGIGAANDYGFLTMITIPFAYCWYKATESKRIKKLLIFYGLMTLASVFYSGTRGALLGVVVFALLNMRSIKQVMKSLALITVLLALTYSVLPTELKHRYFGFIVDSSQSVRSNQGADDIARTSALDRLQGLYAGWKLALASPVTGFGPGSSAVARKRVNLQSLFSNERDLQLHNVYGQVLAEAGFVGFFIVSFIILFYFRNLRRVNQIDSDNEDFRNIKFFLRNSVLLMLFYGFVNHNLYEYYWFLFFALHGGFIYVIEQSKTTTSYVQ